MALEIKGTRKAEVMAGHACTAPPWLVSQAMRCTSLLFRQKHIDYPRNRMNDMIDEARLYGSALTWTKER